MLKKGHWYEREDEDSDAIRKISTNVFFYFSSVLGGKNDPILESIKVNWSNWYNDGDVLILASQVLGEEE